MCIYILISIYPYIYAHTYTDKYIYIYIYINKYICIYINIFNLSAALLNLSAYMHIFMYIHVLSYTFLVKMNKENPLSPQMEFLPGDHASRCILVGDSGFYWKKWLLILCVFVLANELQIVIVGTDGFCLFLADGHTTSNAPDLFRPPKLSGVGPGQY